MSNRQYFLYRQDVTVVVRENGDSQERKFTGVGEMFETPRGGLLLQDMNAVTMTMYAAGEWVSATVTSYAPADGVNPGSYATNEPVNR